MREEALGRGMQPGEVWLEATEGRGGSVTGSVKQASSIGNL